MFGVLTVFGEGALCGYGVMCTAPERAGCPRDLSGPHMPYYEVPVRDIVTGRVLRDAGPPGWGWSRAARSVRRNGFGNRGRVITAGSSTALASRSWI